LINYFECSKKNLAGNPLNKKHTISLEILNSAQIADCVITQIGLQIPNIIDDNPYNRFIIENFDPMGIVPLKIAGTLFIYSLAERLRNVNKEGYLARVKAPRPTNGFLTSVSFYNFINIHTALS
jgi:hypothetical protein